MIKTVPVLWDNYSYMVYQEGDTATVVIDPSEAEPVLKVAQEQGRTITHIINTHHHEDHVAGNLEIQNATGCEIIGSEYDKDRVPGLNRTISGGDQLDLGGLSFEVFFIPAHTLGHIALYIASEQAVFTGDTLFLMGCGKLFEGSPEQMWAAMQCLKQLPPETQVYCGHEYTSGNAQFALSLEPKNAAIQERLDDALAKDAATEPTVPAALALEMQTNPFMRVDDPAFLEDVGLGGKTPEAALAAIRQRKDQA